MNATLIEPGRALLVGHGSLVMTLGELPWRGTKKTRMFRRPVAAAPSKVSGSSVGSGPPHSQEASAVTGTAVGSST